MADSENTATAPAGATPPPPPVPLDLDIRRLWWMKLDIGALLNSEFNTRTADDTAWRAGVTLWCRAWHQVPAGSLPDDDAALCYLSGLGRDLKTWKRVRADALRGFVPCDGGRLYHGFLCKLALEAHEEAERTDARRQRERDRKAAARSAGCPADSGGNSGGKSSTRQDKTYNPLTLLPATSADELVWRNRLAKGPGGLWLTSWGPKPGEPGCEAPGGLVASSPWAIQGRAAA